MQFKSNMIISSKILWCLASTEYLKHCFYWKQHWYDTIKLLGYHCLKMVMFNQEVRSTLCPEKAPCLNFISITLPRAMQQQYTLSDHPVAHSCHTWFLRKKYLIFPIFHCNMIKYFYAEKIRKQIWKYINFQRSLAGSF